MQVEYVEPTQLKPHPRNYRKHPPEQLEHIAQSLKAHGFYKNVVAAQDGTILAGHGTVAAAIKLEFDFVPVIRLPIGPDDPRALKVLAGDNETSRLAQDDQESLARLLRDVGSSVDLVGTGFDAKSLERLLKATGQRKVDEDDAPATRETSIQRGDLFRIGQHLVLCGDATNRLDYETLLGKAEADILLTDPPYGVAYDGGRGKAKHGPIENDDLTILQLGVLLQESLKVASEKLMPGAAAFVFHADQKPGIRPAFEIAFINVFHLGGTIVWVKPAASMGWQDYRSRYEPCLYGWKEGEHERLQDRSETNVWEIGRDAGVTYKHPTQKPVELYARAIRNHTVPGGLVLDPFCGSGTAVVASQQLDRRCYAMDVDPRYVQVTVDRWENLTGLKATKL